MDTPKTPIIKVRGKVIKEATVSQPPVAAEISEKEMLDTLDTAVAIIAGAGKPQPGQQPPGGGGSGQQQQQPRPFLVVYTIESSSAFKTCNRRSQPVNSIQEACQEFDVFCQTATGDVTILNIIG